MGAFFLLNLTLAVIKSKFTEEHKKKKTSKGSKKKKKKKRKHEEELSDEEEMRREDQSKKKDLNDSKDKEFDPESKRKGKEKAATQDLIKKLDILLA